MAEEKTFVPNPQDTFTYKKKKYYVLVHAVNIPLEGVGELTAADILVNKEAQEYLVEQKCVGSVIAEVVEAPVAPTE